MLLINRRLDLIYYIIIVKVYLRKSSNIELLRRQKKYVINTCFLNKTSVLGSMARNNNWKCVDSINFNDIENKINAIPKSNNPSIDLMEYIIFYDYMKIFGDIRIGRMIGKHVYVLAHTIQNGYQDITPRFIGAMFNLDLELSIKNFFIYKNCDVLGKSYYNDVIGAASFFLEKKIKQDNLWLKGFTKTDLDFYEFIKNRSIAIVGPSKSDSYQGREIDSYDIVIRSNYRHSNNFDSGIYGSRTDVSYYNHENVISYSDELTESCKYLKWSMLKSDNDCKKITEDDVKFCNFRTYYTANNLFFDGFPNSIQNIIYDLIRFQPSRMKLFCIDFYINGYSYRDGYIFVERDYLDFWTGVRRHGLVENFSFIKKIHSTGLLELDKQLKEIVKISEEEYAQKIHEQICNSYGDKIN